VSHFIDKCALMEQKVHFEKEWEREKCYTVNSYCCCWIHITLIGQSWNSKSSTLCLRGTGCGFTYTRARIQKASQSRSADLGHTFPFRLTMNGQGELIQHWCSLPNCISGVRFVFHRVPVGLCPLGCLRGGWKPLHWWTALLKKEAWK
jgi:hypothetical protein